MINTLLINQFVKTGALKYGDFTLKSGRKSSYYLEAKRLCLGSRSMAMIIQPLADLIIANHPHLNCIGGVELGIVPVIGALLLRFDALQFLAGRPDDVEVAGAIIRKEAKDHGIIKLVEGPLDPKMHRNVIMVDDVCTTGGSIEYGADILRKQGHEVTDAYVIADREEGGAEALTKVGIKLRALVTAQDIIARAKDIAAGSATADAMAITSSAYVHRGSDVAQTTEN